LSYSNGTRPGLDPEHLQGLIEPVYRYHLARCENYLEAQNLTIQTLSTAAKSIGSFRSERDNLRTWVMGIAHDRQSFGSRHQTTAARQVTGASAPAAPPPSLAYESLPPEQAEILLRDRMSHLSRAWKSLPARQADALALLYFCGLSLAEVSAILHKSEAAVRTFISRESAFEAELLELASSIHPGKDLLALVKAEMSHPTRPQQIWRPASASWRRFSSTGARLGQVGLLVGFLAFGFYIIQRQSVDPASLTPTPAVIPLTGVGGPANPAPTNPAPTTVDNPGSLVPPPAGVCQEWQATLANLIDQPDISVSHASFTDHSQAASTPPGPGDKGTGCLLETTVVNWDLHGAWATFDSISELLFSKNFAQHGDAGYPGYGDNSYFDPGCYGLGRTFVGSDSRAVLTISWCLQDKTAAGTGTPSPANNASNIALDLGGGNPMSIGIRPYLLRLSLATNSLDSFLNTFFSQWSAGSPDIIRNLAPNLLKRFPNYKALDYLAGINPLSSQKVNFVWQVLDNSGSNLRILVHVSETDGQATPTHLNTEFQMALTQNNNTWTIRDLGRSVQFSS
jgi:DNA-directed RNA polymerase specialized sigma24 family protein